MHSYLSFVHGGTVKHIVNLFKYCILNNHTFILVFLFISMYLGPVWKTLAQNILTAFPSVRCVTLPIGAIQAYIRKDKTSITTQQSKSVDILWCSLRVVQVGYGNDQFPSGGRVEIHLVRITLFGICVFAGIFFFHLDCIRASYTVVDTNICELAYITLKRVSNNARCKIITSYRIPESRSLPSSRLSMRLNWLEPWG